MGRCNQLLMSSASSFPSSFPKLLFLTRSMCPAPFVACAFRTSCENDCCCSLQIRGVKEVSNSRRYFSRDVALSLRTSLLARSDERPKTGMQLTSFLFKFTFTVRVTINKNERKEENHKRNLFIEDTMKSELL